MFRNFKVSGCVGFVRCRKLLTHPSPSLMGYTNERTKMGKNIVQKIFSSHLVCGKLKVGEEIAISVDQTLTQDATGTMTYLQFEAMGIPKVKTKLSVSYVDHNTLQTGFENF